VTDSHPTPDPRPAPCRTAGRVLALILAAGPATAGAQQQRHPPPEAVARAVVAADSTGDWVALLRLAHPDALVRFRGLQTFQLRTLGSTEWPAADSLGMDSLEVDSTVQARWQRARTRQVRFMLDSVFLVPTVDSLAHTSPDTVFVRWFRGTRAASVSDSTATAPKRPPAYRVIGAVRASDTLAYVVVERPVVQPLGPMPEMFRDFPRDTHQTEVMIMRRYGKAWRSMLDGVGEPYGYSADLGHEE
jgi:hypothetical protein